MRGDMGHAVGVLDVNTGRFLEFAPPPVFKFQVTSDETRPAALHADWDQGALRPTELIIYGLSLKNAASKPEAGDGRELHGISDRSTAGVCAPAVRSRAVVRSRGKRRCGRLR